MRRAPVLWIISFLILLCLIGVLIPITKAENSPFFLEQIKTSLNLGEKPSINKKIYSLNETVDVNLGSYDGSKLQIKITDSKGVEVAAKKIYSKDKIRFKPTVAFKPGKYSIKVINGSTEVLNDTFVWGVLAINTDKSIYLQNELVKFSFAVLDETGKMVCDAKLKLTIKNESANIVDELSTENGKITVNPECYVKGLVLNPDYFSEYEVIKTGKYNLTLTAETQNGTYSIDDSFEVWDSVDFDVSRDSATRIYPPEKYPLTFKIKANKDFNGEIRETVPSSFQIYPPVKNLPYSQVEEKDGVKNIIWQLKIKSGQEVNLGYYYQAPNISPQYYLLGPLEFVEQQKIIKDPIDFQEGNQSDLTNEVTIQENSVFKELRQWQVAADDTTGPNNPSSAISSGGGTVAWTSPTNVYASDNSRASVSLGKGVISQYLQATGFGFTIPTTATINGIQVDIERYANNTLIRDNSLKLIKNGNISGDETADTATGWPSSDTYKSYGGNTDLWGLTWTPTDINSSNFGVALDIKNNKTGSGATYIGYVDHIRITVYYTVPITLTQTNYRWYINNPNSSDVTDPWPNGVVDVAENTPIGIGNSPPTKNNVLRLRVSIKDTDMALLANSRAFKLKYTPKTSTCGTSWSDIGTTGSTTSVWRAYDNVNVTGDTVLTSANLTGSNVLETYTENNVTVNNPNAININQIAEWDWVIQNYNAGDTQAYCFKMVNSDDSDLSGGYTNIPELITAPKQVIITNLSGTVFADDGTTNIGPNKTVKVLVNGVSVGTTETDASGRWQINTPDLNDGDVITTYLSGETEKGSTVYISDVLTHSDINIRQNRLIVHSDSGTFINEKFISGNGSDTDQSYSVSSRDVTINSGISLFVPLGTTFNITAKLVVNHNLQVDGSLTGDQIINILGGSVTGDGQINLTHGSFLLKGTGNFGGSTNWNFYDLNFGDGTGSGTTSKIGTNSISIDGILTVDQSHTLNAGSSNWNFDGDRVSPLTDIKNIDAGYDQTCAVKTDGTVYCWGLNNYYQLGDYSAVPKSVPVQVVGLNNSGVLSDISQVSVGSNHVCALKSDGSAVYCWGLDTSGQCGDNDTATTEYYPTQVLGLGGTGVLSDISQITTGRNFTCAVKTDSTVYCWGDDYSGQLGDGYIGTELRKYPVQVKDVGGVGVLSGILKITAGYEFTCALKNDNTTYCWGNNNYGQIGIGSTLTQSTPNQVKGVDGTGVLSDISQITTGNYHTCALKTDGSVVYCWGYNSYGQIGNNQSGNNVLVPETVSGSFSPVASVTQVDAGLLHTCALKKDNTVFCWGYNSYGQLGIDNTNDYLVPVQVLGSEGVGYLNGIEMISMGKYHSCAMKNNGIAISCWGNNQYGQLGNNTVTDLYNPNYVVGNLNLKPISYVKSVSVGNGQACTVKDDDSAVYCWGYGLYGVLGNRSSNGNFQYTPIQVVGLGGTGTLSSVSQVFSGYSSTCALKTGDSSLNCWGSGSYGTLGTGSTEATVSFPTQVKDVSGSGLLTNISQVGIGYNHVCALKDDNYAYCWGYNRNGQLGIGNTANQSLPNQVKGVGGTGTAPPFSQISVGYNHTCSLKSDGTAVYCWGGNDYGQIGIGNTIRQTGLIQVKGVSGSGYLSNISQIASGYNFNFAIDTNNSFIYAWGQNNRGQLGIGDTENQYYPVRITDFDGDGKLSDIIQISAGYYHSCALKAAGTVLCWGRNSSGQLGNGLYSDWYSPEYVIGIGGSGILSGITQISSGAYTTCAYQSATDRLLCWGEASNGTLGNNSTVDSPYPIYVSTDSFKPFDIKGSLVSDSSTFEYSSLLSTSKHVVSQIIESATYNNLTINNSSYLSILNGNITSNDFNLASGILLTDFKSLTVGGNFTNSGVFNANKSLVTINGSNNSILDYSSDTTFYDLSISGVGRTIFFDPTYKTNITHSLNFQGQSCNNKLYLKSYVTNNQWDLNYTGIGSSAFVNYVDLHDSNAINPLTANNSSQINDNNTNWTINQGTCTANQPPAAPTSLVQYGPLGLPISVGGYIGLPFSFSAQASDPDLSDSLKLCVEIKDVNESFVGIANYCGSFVQNNEVGVTVTYQNYEISWNSGAGYHWQARIEDSSGNSSDWVPFGDNDESREDFIIDTSYPAGMAVYDGLNSGVDQSFNNGSLSSLSANWSGIDPGLSGLNHYKYSIGTDPETTDVLNWVNIGTGTSVTVSNLNLKTNTIYYFKVWAVNNANNSEIFVSNGQMVAPSLSFNVNPNSINFDNLSTSNNFSVGSTATLTVSTNAYNGFEIRTYIKDLLKSPDSLKTIQNFNGGTYNQPDGWVNTDRGFGYHSSDNDIQGINKFNSLPYCLGGNSPPCFSPFSTFEPGDIVADHTSNITGTPVTDEKFTIDYQIKTDPTQAATNYSTTVVYSLTAKY
jgi:alpha-tubulin suppressor-like RCC1 family protein